MTARFTADDLDRANDAWRAKCGPGSVAAICGLTLDEVRPHFAALGFESKGFTNPTMMYEVMRRVRGSAADGGWTGRALGSCITGSLFWPRYGLARIQWEGRWTRPGVPMRARYRETHWVGAWVPGNGSIGIFDVNAMRSTSAGDGWVSVDDWANVIVPAILEGHKGADGKWHITHAIEVRR